MTRDSFGQEFRLEGQRFPATGRSTYVAVALLVALVGTVSPLVRQPPDTAGTATPIASAGTAAPIATFYNPNDPYLIYLTVASAPTPTAFASLNEYAVSVATDIFVGRVVAMTDMKAAGTPALGTVNWGWTRYTVEVLQPLRGTAAGTVTVWQIEVQAAELPPHVLWVNRRLETGQTAVFLVAWDATKAAFRLPSGANSYAVLETGADRDSAVATVVALAATPRASR
jgi:hypothetical protein